MSNAPESIPACLSSASILRCSPLTRFEAIILVIPTFLELIFTFLLLVKRPRSGRYNLALLLEGWLYFAAAFLDLLSRIIPAVRDSLRIFTFIDDALAVSSSVVILIYFVFMFLFVRAEIDSSLPRGGRFVTQAFIILFIPVTIALNTLASFLGISRRTLVVNGVTDLFVGFTTLKDQTLWQFFTSITLAFLAAIQAFLFTLTFYRTIRAYVNRHIFESNNKDANHLIRGIIWLALGFKFGAIESVVGFVQGGGYVFILRRVLRLLSRLFLVIGLIKGVDVIEDFEDFRTTMEKKPPLGPTYIISNPRGSTFQRLDIDATKAFNAGQAPNPSGRKHNLNQRVTVHYERGQPPTLRLRFSELEVISPTQVVENMKRRPESYWIKSKSTVVPLEFSDISTSPSDTTTLDGFPEPPGFPFPTPRPMPQLPQAVLLAQDQAWKNQDPFENSGARPDPHRRSGSSSKHSSTWSSMYAVSIVGAAQPMSDVAAGKQRATHYSASAYSAPRDSHPDPYSRFLRDSRSSNPSIYGRSEFEGQAPMPSANGQAEFDLQAPMPSGASAFFSQPQPVQQWADANYPAPLMNGTGYSASSPQMAQRTSLEKSYLRSGHSSEEFDKAWQGHHDDDEHAEIALAVSRRAEVAEIKSVTLPTKRTPMPIVDPVTRVSVGVEQVLGGSGGSPTEEQDRNRLRYLQGGPMGPRPRLAKNSTDTKSSFDGLGAEY